MERSRAVQTYNGTLTPEQLRQIAAIEDAAERLAALEAAYGSMPQPGEHVPSWTDKHVNDEMASRGWTAQDIDDILADPLLVIPTRDQRNIDQALGGGKRDDPATAYYRASNDYVVRNDRTGEIIQVSDRNKLDWEPRFPPSGLDFGDLE